MTHQSQDGRMSDIYPGAGIFPRTVEDLSIFKVRAHCGNCGRLVVLTPAMLSKLERHLALADLLARLQCKGNLSSDPRDKGCGARPDELHILIEPPPNPIAYRPIRMWVMDGAGEWEEPPYDVLDDMAER
jgi:hypothetical protein